MGECKMSTIGELLGDEACKKYIEETSRIMGELYRQLTDWRETQLKKSLIALGWTPPKGDECEETDFQKECRRYGRPLKDKEPSNAG